ncbi:MAG: OB-fold nucleic acid binding domain-containing protein, partial [Flavobacteriaceae bacterium]
MSGIQTAIEYLKGVGPERARLLKEELNIKTFQDLLHFFPNRYIDRSQFYAINQLPQTNTEVQVKGKITQIEYISQKRGKRMVAQFEDETGAMELVWFRGYQWIRESLKINQSYVIFGRLNWFKGRASMPHPEKELEVNFQKNVKAAFYPIYPSTEKLINKGISQRVIQKLVAHLIEKGGEAFAE